MTRSPGQSTLILRVDARAVAGDQCTNLGSTPVRAPVPASSQEILRIGQGSSKRDLPCSQGYAVSDEAHSAVRRLRGRFGPRGGSGMRTNARTNTGGAIGTAARAEGSAGRLLVVD